MARKAQADGGNGLETGDQLTMDGLRVYEVVDADAQRFGDDGVELSCVSHDEEGTIFKTDLQISVRWRAA